jgi:ABC-type phosphate/phosphonate transport system substrate-binding protein
LPSAAPVASLPMYDWPELRRATDALWHAIARRLADSGIAAPATLERRRAAEDVWRDPGLVFSQTCGFPYATRLRGLVSLVATPIYEAEGCKGPLYSSFLVARGGEGGGGLAGFAGRRVAFNARDSLSGYVVLVAAMRDASLSPEAFEWMATGGHRDSVRAVAEGRADLAAIDAVCWALAARFETEAAERLSVIGQTALRPALPFISAGGRSADELDAMRSALADALASSETEEARAALCLAGVAATSAAHYQPLAVLLS